ncbi:hypothetical protein N7537_009640 [Penicillium hordei]|uniref:Nuclear transport factor 2 family protein n=1 Tax=Penicillium hordei TaxID=40994 RepID=A0AAD6DT96_9EURO|nr:uncharacterized protein N7537_009640 [Penicillium hordei]KAJ5592736.1 hypothetical protein N7537_009640 [Penicillium hordei]
MIRAPAAHCLYYRTGPDSKPCRRGLKPIPASQYNEVLDAAAIYVDGMRTGDLAYTSKGFRDTATVYGYIEDKFQEGSVNLILNYMKTQKEPPVFSVNLSVIGMTPSTAVVKCEMDIDAPEYEYTDFMSLAKVDGKWQIVAKVFHAYLDE